MRSARRLSRCHARVVSVVVSVTVLSTIVVSGSLPDAVGAGQSGVWRSSAQVVEPSVFVHAAVVRLVTGDRVRVLTRVDGTSVSTILPGSPHEGGPLARWQSGDGSYVLPRTSSSERRRLDLSLFDVTALARYPVRVPIVVRFASHTRVHRVRGLRLESTVVGSRSSSIVVRGSYGPAFRGLTARDLAGISSVRLAASAHQPSSSTPTHRVVVQVLDPGGHPAPGVVVTLVDVDDASTFQVVTAAGGRSRFDVPDGHYSALGFNFNRVVIAPEFNVTADQTVGLDLGEATVKPHVSLPGYRKVDTALSIDRAAENGFTFPFSFTGSHFFTRVQPASAHVPDGALGTGVSATLVPRGSGHRAYDRIAVTADIARGVPDDLTFAHHRRDFAKVIDRMYANGPSGLRESFFGAFGDLPNGYLDLFSGQELPTHVPGRRVVLFEAGRHSSYQQTLMPQTTPDSDDLTQLGTTASYRRAGTSQVVTFAHGPVGPGVRGNVAPSTNYVRRKDGRFVADLPLFESAGSSMFSYVDKGDGAWSLRTRGRVLAHGHHEIHLHAKVPAAARTYELRATSEPVSPTWTLSTLVRDVWTFRSGGDHPAAPLLMPRYVPPVSMNGSLRAGRTSFRLGLHSLTRHDHRIVGAQVQLSTDDGASWHDARLTRTSPSTFRVAYRNPAAHRSARFMSMRIVAQDAAGDSVTETAMRVYQLR